MLKKKWLLALAFGLILTMTACAPDEGEVVTPPPAEDSEEVEEEAVPGEDMGDEMENEDLNEEEVNP